MNEWIILRLDGAKTLSELMLMWVSGALEVLKLLEPALTDEINEKL